MLARAHELRVPREWAQNMASDDAFIELKWIDARANTAYSEQQLGKRRAALHWVQAERFGWDSDNYIGRSFWRERRLRPQVELTVQHV